MQINNIFNKITQPIISLFLIILITANVFSSASAANTSKDNGGFQKTKHISINAFEKDIDKIYKELNQKSAFNAGNCDEYIENITNFLLLQSAKIYLPLTQRDFRRLEKRGDIIVEKLFLLRLLLRKKLKEFYLQGKITPNCVKKMRMAFRYSRFMEEFITEIRVSMNKEVPAADHRDLSQHKYQFYLNPKYKNFRMKSGDILLVRASNFVSAVIARIGDDDGQFSHAAMIYIDEKGIIYVIEALISKGIVIVPFEEWREKNHHARTLLFRHDNKKLAKKAAQKLHDTILERWKAKDLMLYDFQMDDSDSKQFFCSEVVQYSFKLAGNDSMPIFQTSFKSFQNHSFLSELTIGVNKAFAPSDLEVDPHINLVAEWRNYAVTKNARMEDVIQTKVLYWMSHKDYYLKGTFKSWLSTSVGLLGRNIFGLNSDKIPPNMPYGFIENIIKLTDLNEILEKYLLGLETEYFKKYGHSMDYLTMMNALEKFRIEDCERDITRKKEINDRILYHIDDWEKPYKGSDPLFHNLFNTKNGLECNAQVEGF